MASAVRFARQPRLPPELLLDWPPGLGTPHAEVLDALTILWTALNISSLPSEVTGPIDVDMFVHAFGQRGFGGQTSLYGIAGIIGEKLTSFDRFEVRPANL